MLQKVIIPKKGRKLSPAQVIILGYAVTILLGSFLLTLPIASAHRFGERRCPFIDALFTATSAVCVTGLIVRDTSVDFSPFGQIVILTLIQIGGLGYMTVATILSLLIGKRISLRERVIMQEALSQFTLGGVVRFALRVLKITLTIEGIAAIILTYRWSQKYGFHLLKALYLGIFHAVSGFCNAGFSLFSNNLVDYVCDAPIIFVMSFLIISGGIGFIVISDLYKCYIERSQIRLSVHSRLALFLTGCLILLGTVTILIAEWNNALSSLPSPFYKLLAAYFHAVTPRTAGFNIINIGNLRYFTLLVIMLLMFIGASPGGTGGGIKTTTFGILLSAVYATLSGRRKIVLFGREISNEAIWRALTLFVLALTLLFFSIVTLMISEKVEFARHNAVLKISFEVFSAFGTVGLSTGSVINKYCSYAYDFSNFGKLILIFTMFCGRLGPLTIGVALTTRKPELVSYPEEKVLIG